MKKTIRLNHKIIHGYEILAKPPTEILQGVKWVSKYKFKAAYSALKSKEALDLFFNDENFKEERLEMKEKGYKFKTIKLF